MMEYDELITDPEQAMETLSAFFESDGYPSKIIDNEHNRAMAEDLEHGQFLFIASSSWSYEGYINAVFKRDDKWYQVEASHCSCDGFNGKWEPEEIEPAQLWKQDWGKKKQEMENLFTKANIPKVNLEKIPTKVNFLN